MQCVVSSVYAASVARLNPGLRAAHQVRLLWHLTPVRRVVSCLRPGYESLPFALIQCNGHFVGVPQSDSRVNNHLVKAKSPQVFTEVGAL